MSLAYGSYDVLGPIGRGAQGPVYRARHRSTGAVRAVKVLEGHGDREAEARFRREAEVLARASGAGVVVVHECGTGPGGLWFAMDLMEGGSLRDRLAHGRLDPLEAARLVAKLARAVHRCHELGLVHRDLKPENVLFARALDLEEPNVADFGLARDARSQRLTLTGSLLGTPAYMAPEQILAAEGVDRRADVFALGLILFELLTGTQARPVRGLLDLAASVGRESFPAPSKLAGSPRRLDAIVARSLARSLDDRTPDALTLALELEAAVAGKPPAKAPPPVGRRGLLALLGLALLALPLGALATVRIAQRSETPRPLPSPLARVTPTPEPADVTRWSASLAALAKLPATATVTSDQLPAAALERLLELRSAAVDSDLANVASRAPIYSLEAIAPLVSRNPDSSTLRVLRGCAALGSGDLANRALARQDLGNLPVRGRAGELGRALVVSDELAQAIEGIDLAETFNPDSPVRRAIERKAATLADHFARADASGSLLEGVLAPILELARDTARDRDLHHAAKEVTDLSDPRRRGLNSCVGSLREDRLPLRLLLLWVVLQSGRNMTKDPMLETWRARWRIGVAPALPVLEAIDPVLAAAGEIEAIELDVAAAQHEGRLLTVEATQDVVERLEHLSAVLLPRVEAADGWARVLEIRRRRMAAQSRLRIACETAPWSDCALVICDELGAIFDQATAWRLPGDSLEVARQLTSMTLQRGVVAVRSDVLETLPDSDVLRAEHARMSGNRNAAIRILDMSGGGFDHAIDGNVYAIRALVSLDDGDVKRAREEWAQIDRSTFAPAVDHLSWEHVRDAIDQHSH